MTTPIKLILGAVATLLVAVGVAAQTGTVQVPRDTPNGGVSGMHQPPAVAPPGTPTSQPSPTPDATPADTTTVTVAAPPSGGEDGGGGEGHGHGNGHGHGGD